MQVPAASPPEPTRTEPNMPEGPCREARAEQSTRPSSAVSNATDRAGLATEQANRADARTVRPMAWCGLHTMRTRGQPHRPSPSPPRRSKPAPRRGTGLNFNSQSTYLMLLWFCTLTNSITTKKSDAATLSQWGQDGMSASAVMHPLTPV